MKRKILFLIVTIIISVSAIGLYKIFSQRQKSLFLKYNIQPTENLTYQCKYLQDINLDMNGQPMTATKDFQIAYQIQGKEKRDKSILATVNFLSANASLIMMGGKQRLDTRNIADEKFDIEMLADGSMRQNKGIENVSGIQMGAMAGGEQKLGIFMDYTFPKLPQKQIKIGDTWTEKIERRQIESAIPVKSNIEIRHTVESFEKLMNKKCVKILSNPVAKCPVNQAKWEMGQNGNTKENLREN